MIFTKKRKALFPALVLGMSLAMTVSAHAEGWEQLGSNWIYKDANGQRITNEWRKGADGKYRWLDSAGDMARDQWVDFDKYYVDSDGIYVESGWKKIKDHWYYFTSNGKPAKETWKKIDNKWYYFDDEGKMGVGWLLDNMYYCGEDGVMHTGWHRLLSPDSDGEEGNRLPTPGNEGGSDDKKWYFFSNSGKKFVPNLENGAEYGEGRISGVRYCFSAEGALQTGWVNIKGTDKDSAGIRDFRYYNQDGTLRTGWYSIEPPENTAENYYNSVEWFYFNASGVPRASEDERLNASDILKINGRQYLFNKRGNPVYGLQKVYTGNGEEYTAYYFGTQKQSHVQKGKIRIKEIGNHEEVYYFMESTGRGYTGVKDSYLYYMGKLQKADKGTKYQVISLPSGNNGKVTNYVVNTAGKISKNGKVKDGDKVEYKTNASGVLTHIDGSAEGIDGVFIAPVEPEFTEN